jgi:hypothetical protein
MSRINNHILFFPNATMASKYSKEELMLGILEFAVLPHWRKAFDLRDYLPSNDDKARFIEECERIKRNKTPVAREYDNSDDDHKNDNKNKLEKSEQSSMKRGQKSTRESSHKYCMHFKTDTHTTENY